MLVRLLSKILICALACAGVWALGLIWFMMQIPTEANREHKSADAVVVFTGGGGRLELGLQLLADGKARALFISGVGTHTTSQDIIRQASAPLRNRLQQMETLPIFLGRQARNTIGNAEETAEWIKKRQYKTILLVTTNYHLPRSINEFKELMPDVTLIPEPVISDEFTLQNWWYNQSVFALLMSEYHKYLVSRLRHWFVSLTPVS